MDLSAIERLPIPLLLRNTKLAFGNERVSTASVVAHLAIVDHQRAYRDAGFDSLHSYCCLGHGLSKEAANKRIRVARVVRRFPQVLEALEDGRLHLSGAVVLAASLTAANVDALLEAASHKSQDEIEALVAELTPRLPMPTSLHPVEVSARTPGMTDPGPEAVDGAEPPASPSQVSARTLVTGQSHSRSAPAVRVEPVGNREWQLHMRVDGEFFAELKRLQELLGHPPAHALDKLFLDLLRGRRKQIEKQRYGTTDKPRKARPSTNDRYIPKGVKTVVAARDGRQCTFVSDSGQRCPCRSRLEYDHIKPLARGGKSTVGNLRLRCRSHNQWEAERLFGAGFMEAKRSRAKRSEGSGAAAPGSRDAMRIEHPNDDVIPWLRALGYCADEATRIAHACITQPEASLEERVRDALRTARSALAGCPPGAEACAFPVAAM